MTNKLFFGNLDWTTDKDEVHDYFSPFGEIVEISIAVDKESGHSRGFGFVTYEREESARDAIQNLDGSEFKGRKLGVKAAEANKERTLRCNGNDNNSSSYNGCKNNRRDNCNNNDDRNGAYSNGYRRNSGSNGFFSRRGSSPRYQKRERY